MLKKNHRKAILKTLSWRILSSIGFFLLLLLWSEDLKVAGGLTLADAIIKTILYYGHELYWQGKLK